MATATGPVARPRAVVTAQTAGVAHQRESRRAGVVGRLSWSVDAGRRRRRVHNQAARLPLTRRAARSLGDALGYNGHRQKKSKHDWLFCITDGANTK